MLPVSTKYHYPILKFLSDRKVHTKKEIQDALIKEFAITKEDLKVTTKGGDKCKGSPMFYKWIDFAIKNLRDASFVYRAAIVNRAGQYAITEDGILYLNVNKDGFKGSSGSYLRTNFLKVVGNIPSNDLKNEVEPIKTEAINTKSDKNVSGEKGFVYILTNPAFQTYYIKIGYTQNIEQRLKELYNTSIPLPFTVYALLETAKYKQAEKLLHSTFKSSRFNEDREFFMLNPEVAFEQMKVIAESFDAILYLYDDKGKVK